MDSAYDIFEIMPDGAPTWKCCVQGMDAALKELASQTKKSNNEIKVVHLSTGAVIARSAPKRQADHAASVQSDSSRFITSIK